MDHLLIQDTLHYIKHTQASTCDLFPPASPFFCFLEDPPLHREAPAIPVKHAPVKKQVQEVQKPLPKEPPLEPIKLKEHAFELAPPQAPSIPLFESLKKTVQKIDPELFIHDKIPSDEKARRIKNRWQTQFQTPKVPILHGGEHLEFLAQLSKAIEVVFESSHVIPISKYETEKKWDIFLESPQLELIIAPDIALWNAKDLLRFYKESPQKGKRFLGKIPLLLLPDLSLYQKDTYLKRSLWNVICQTIQKK